MSRSCLARSRRQAAKGDSLLGTMPLDCLVKSGWGKCMVQRLAVWLALAVLALGFGGSTRPAQANGFCTCCLNPMPEACAKACEARPATPNQCPAFVIYEGAGAVGPNGNPLNAMSLKELDMGKPHRSELE